MFVFLGLKHELKKKKKKKKQEKNDDNKNNDEATFDEVSKVFIQST